MQDDYSFERAMRYMFAREGGYVNDPTDRGGETKYGISKAAFPHVNIAALTKEDAAKIYYNEYWLKARCNKMPFDVALAVFDAAVQHGIKPAIQQLQRAVGVSDDGIIGPATLEALRNANIRQVCMKLMVERGRYYAKIIARTPAQAKFLDGWFNRLKHLACELCLDF